MTRHRATADSARIAGACHRPVDLYIPGCPPSAKRIRAVLEQIVAGKPVEMVGREMLKFG
jgi:coenzyme F420-reducing hydrogenase gamma subunit